MRGGYKFVLWFLRLCIFGHSRNLFLTNLDMGIGDRYVAYMAALDTLALLSGRRD